MNNVERKAKWNVGFSYGRALQHSCLKAWKGTDIVSAQQALIARARANSEASQGIYKAGSQPSSDEELFVAFFVIIYATIFIINSNIFDIIIY